MMNQAKSTKRPWTVEEDATLLRLIEEYGSSGSWPKIAFHMDARTGKQCRERYINQLDPNVKKTPWTFEEDAMIRNLHETLGKRWCKFMDYLPGRSDNAIKNRWHIISRNDYADHLNGSLYKTSHPMNCKYQHSNCNHQMGTFVDISMPDISSIHIRSPRSVVPPPEQSVRSGIADTAPEVLLQNPPRLNAIAQPAYQWSDVERITEELVFSSDLCNSVEEYVSNPSIGEKQGTAETFESGTTESTNSSSYCFAGARNEIDTSPSISPRDSNDLTNCCDDEFEGLEFPDDLESDHFDQPLPEAHPIKESIICDLELPQLNHTGSPKNHPNLQIKTNSLYDEEFYLLENGGLSFKTNVFVKVENQIPYATHDGTAARSEDTPKCNDNQAVWTFNESLDLEEEKALLAVLDSPSAEKLGVSAAADGSKGKVYHAGEFSPFHQQRSRPLSGNLASTASLLMLTGNSNCASWKSSGELQSQQDFVRNRLCAISAPSNNSGPLSGSEDVRESNHGADWTMPEHSPIVHTHFSPSCPQNKRSRGHYPFF